MQINHFGTDAEVNFFGLSRLAPLLQGAQEPSAAAENASNPQTNTPGISRACVLFHVEREPCGVDQSRSGITT
ncbi:hypothetical protein [Lysobacter enzymogenes]|uniref:hypothetical protein n=1 Tax=Lysobacter enzymogenes TaxID=69 RepID=UPI0011AB2DF5|nr:hypothetical protein [Lysobacter enzymogenes]